MAVKRINELDFLKGILILLVVVFHLAYFSDLHPVAHKIVYTFHMPAFLIISGFLMKTNRTVKDFLRIMLWFVIPYAIMEIGYITASGFLPVRGAVPFSELNAETYIRAIMLEPIGPYWYFHTLIICSTGYYFIFYFSEKLFPKINLASKLIATGLLFFVLWKLIPSVNIYNSMYLLIGMTITQTKVDFRKIFHASWFSIIPFVLFCFCPACLDRATLSGVLITWLSISILLSIYKILPNSIQSKFNFIGFNTLPIYLFSPIFTMLSKIFIPVFSYDKTGLLFMITALIVSVSGSLAIGIIMDMLHISRYFFGKERIIMNHS